KARRAPAVRSRLRRSTRPNRTCIVRTAQEQVVVIYAIGLFSGVYGGRTYPVLRNGRLGVSEARIIHKTWHSHPAPGSASMKSLRRSARAGWGWSTAPATRN